MILSEKHGLNPSITKCAICDKDIGIALFGKMKDDIEAPKEVCLGEICDECKKKFKENKERVLFKVLNSGDIDSTYYIIKEEKLPKELLQKDVVIYLHENCFKE